MPQTDRRMNFQILPNARHEHMLLLAAVNSFPRLHISMAHWATCP